MKDIAIDRIATIASALGATRPGQAVSINGLLTSYKYTALPRLTQNYHLQAFGPSCDGTGCVFIIKDTGSTEPIALNSDRLGDDDIKNALDITETLFQKIINREAILADYIRTIKTRNDSARNYDITDSLVVTQITDDPVINYIISSNPANSFLVLNGINFKDSSGKNYVIKHIPALNPVVLCALDVTGHRVMMPLKSLPHDELRRLADILFQHQSQYLRDSLAKK